MRYIFDQNALARCFLARIRWLQGYPDQAMEIACDVTNDERWCIAEVLRIKGELLHRQGKFEGSDTAFATARVWAEQQGALSLSLRIATGAARLWLDMGRAAAARAELAAVCDRFTEGFGTADYRNARAVLDALSPEIVGH